MYLVLKFQGLSENVTGPQATALSESVTLALNLDSDSQKEIEQEVKMGLFRAQLPKLSPLVAWAQIKISVHPSFVSLTTPPPPTPQPEVRVVTPRPRSFSQTLVKPEPIRPIPSIAYPPPQPPEPAFPIYPEEPLPATLNLCSNELAITAEGRPTLVFELHSVFFVPEFPDTATLGVIQSLNTSQTEERRFVITGQHLLAVVCAVQQQRSLQVGQLLRRLAPDARSRRPVHLHMILAPDRPVYTSLERLWLEAACAAQARQRESGVAWLVQVDLEPASFPSVLLCTPNHLCVISPPPSFSSSRLPDLRLNIQLNRVTRLNIDDDENCLHITTRNARLRVRADNLQEIFNYVQPVLKGQRPKVLLHSDSFNNWKTSRNTQSPTPGARRNSPLTYKFSSRELRFEMSETVNPVENFLIGEPERLLDEVRGPIWEEFRINLESAILSRANPALKSIRTLPIEVIYEGIPLAHRPTVWELLSGANNLSSASDQYADILEYYAGEVSPSQSSIEKDLNRSMPGHPIYSTPEGIEKLRRVLTAYSWRNPDIGYCQSMNIVTAFLLLLYNEDRAFWMLTVIAETLLPAYWTPLMSGALAAQRVVNHLVAERLPRLAEHLIANNVDAGLVAFQWFLQLFIGKLPQACLFCFLDHFFLEGQKALFRWAIAILTVLEGRLLAEEEDVQRILVNVLTIELNPLLKAVKSTELEVDHLLKRADACVLVQLTSALNPPEEENIFKPIQKERAGSVSVSGRPTSANGDRRTPATFFLSLFGKK